MGNRVSIRFSDGERSSPFLFSHWDGQDFVTAAQNFVRNLPTDIGVFPLGRREPETVMVAFIQDYLKDKELVKDNYYLTTREAEGDNSDNGHWLIDTHTGNIIRHTRRRR